MPEDYYGSEGPEQPAGATATVATDKPEKPEADEEKSTQEGFMVEQSAFMGADVVPGETYEFVAVHDFGKEVEMRYKMPEEPEEKSKPSMKAAEGRLDEMASANMSQEEA